MFRHSTLNTLLTRESGLCGMYVNGRLTGSLPGFRFDSGRSAYLLRIMLSVCRRSMIRVNLSHEKRLLLILLSGVRTEKHNGMYLSWESGGRIVLDVAGSTPAWCILETAYLRGFFYVQKF